MKKITLLITNILLLTAILNAQNTAGKILLNKGQKFTVTSNTKGTVTMEMMGQSMETESETNSTSTIEVKDVTAAGYRLTSTLNKMKFKSKGGMAPAVDFDSDKKEDMNGDIGKNVKDEFNPKESEITLAGKPVETKSANADEDMKKVMQSIMSGVGENGIAGNFLVIPSGKKTGDTWSDSTNENGVKISNVYTLKQITGNDATILQNSVSNAEKTVNAQGAELVVTMNSNVSSNYIVDVATGLIKEKRTTVEGNGSLGAGGQDMPMKTKLTTVTTIKNL